MSLSTSGGRTARSRTLLLLAMKNGTTHFGAVIDAGAEKKYDANNACTPHVFVHYARVPSRVDTCTCS